MPIAHVATGYGSSGETAVRDSDFFHVEYYCPRQAPTWQRRARPIQGYGRATAEARAIKPAAGLARVLTLAGRELYRI